VASVQAHRVIERSLTRFLGLISGVCNPAVRLHEDGWAEILLGVPPVGWAGCGAARAENAFVETVKLLAVCFALEVFFSLQGVSNEIVAGV
jgi:hypothetical protein